MNKKTVSLRKLASPLTARLDRYERARQRLEAGRATKPDMTTLDTALSDPIRLTDGEVTANVRLSEVEHARATLVGLAGPTAVLDVRRTPSGLPSFRLCRVRLDTWTRALVVVEDLHRGAGHRALDSRLARLLVLGCERDAIDLAASRRDIATALGTRPHAAAVDAMLLRIGGSVLASAWRPDQLVAVALAAHLALPTFSRAVELVELARSSDPCELRAATHDLDPQLFADVLERPELAGWLTWLRDASGRDLSAAPGRAAALHARLGGALGTFLSREVPWGASEDDVALRSVVLANMTRLDTVGLALVADPIVGCASRILEDEARAVVRELVPC